MKIERKYFITEMKMQQRLDFFFPSSSFSLSAHFAHIAKLRYRFNLLSVGLNVIFF